ncbi:MAG: CHAT domain-containing protein [Spirochaetia bacterium]|nr:CHAT domain-containing protein [Spirochaetia bacterium]
MSISKETSCTIIIDRVGNTNVFNIIKDKTIDNPFFEGSHGMQSVVDDDLIEEFLEELHRVVKISKSLFSLPDENTEKQAIVFQHLNLNKKIREIGETFFRQFLPEPLQSFIKSLEYAYLFFHIDSKLSSIPLEILHDGQSYLWEKFYVGKSIKGQHSSFEEISAKEIINMLIIADPTEDLEWARAEGEFLYERLTSNFPEKKLNIELVGGSSINKLALLNKIVNKDIIHYSGHLHYSSSPAENGWILYGNKIIRAREIQKTATAPVLIFSNSCISGIDVTRDNEGKDWYSNFASSFLKSGKTNYVGTIWEVPDNKPTLEFTLKFYDEILNGAAIGKALQTSRKYIWDKLDTNDLTWASYLLMGNPSSIIFQAEPKIPDITQNMLDSDMVIHQYPFPIAMSYSIFLKNERERKPTKELLNILFECSSNIIFFLSALVLANFRYLKLTRKLNFAYPNLKITLDNVFHALKNMKTMKIHPIISKLSETFFIQHENLYKIAEIEELILETKKSINLELLESYKITIQFFIETLLIDLEFLKNYGFYKIIEPGSRQLSLAGILDSHKIREIVLPTQHNLSIEEEIIKKTSDIIGKLVFYNPIKRIFLDLSPFMDIELLAGKNKLDNQYKLVYKSEVVSSKNKNAEAAIKF